MKQAAPSPQSSADHARQRLSWLHTFANRWLPLAERNWSVLALLALLVALFYAPLLLGLRTFPDGDFTHHFLPFSLFQRQELLAGRLPLWNPYTYAGHPFLADVQAAVFYPLNNLLLLPTLPIAGAGARLYILQIEAMLHIVLGGFFCYLLVRNLTANATAGLLSGCTFAFSGYLTGYPPLQLAILRTAIWLPLLLLIALFAVQSKSWRWWIGLGVALSIPVLAGHPQTLLHIGYALAAWLLFLWLHLARRIPPPANRGEGATVGSRLHGAYVPAGALLALLVMLGLSAVQLLPSLEFTQLSVRANVSYDYVSGGFPLRDSWQLLLPALFTQFSPLYVGVIGLGLAVCALGVKREARVERERNLWPSQRGLMLFFALLGLVALLLAYGDNGFLYPLFYKLAPGWNYFRGQERTAYLVSLALSILSGIGIAALTAMPLSRRRLLGLTFCCVTFGSVYGLGLLYQLNGATAISEWRYLGIAFVTLLVTVILGLLLWLPGWSGARTGTLLVLTLCNLFWANAGTNVSDFGPVRKTILAPEMEALTAAVASDSEVNRLQGRIYNEFRIYEDYGIRQQLEDVWGSSPLRFTRYAALFENFPLDRMWRLLGVQHVVSWRRELPVPSALLAEFTQSQDTTFIHRLTSENPRAWVVQQIRFASDEEAQRLLADHAFDLEQNALLPEELSTSGSADIVQVGQAGANQIEIERTAPGLLSVSVESEFGGFLVLSENWAPGWRILDRSCTIEGERCTEPNTIPFAAATLTSPLRTNLTLLGLPLSPGTTRFALTYQPNSIIWGLSISGGALLLLIFFAFSLRR